MRALRFGPLLVFLVGCALVPQSRRNFSGDEALDSLKREEKLWEAVGLRLETRVMNFGGLVVSSATVDKVADSQRSQFQIRNPSELANGDILVGMNQQLLIGQPQDAAKSIRRNLEKFGGGILSFLNQQNFNLKLINADYFRISQLRLMESSGSFSVVCVSDVAAGSWAEKRGLQAGDCFIGKAELSEKKIFRKWLVHLFGKIRFLKTKVLSQKERVGVRLDSLESAAKIFLEMFRDFGSFKNKNGDVMELESNLVLIIMRSDRLETILARRHRFLGLGVVWNHRPGFFWGKVEPTVTQVFTGSGAEKAGLRAGDYVAEVNGKKVKTSWDVNRFTKAVGFGKDIEYLVYRGTETLKVKVQMEWVTVE